MNLQKVNIEDEQTLELAIIEASQREYDDKHLNILERMNLVSSFLRLRGRMDHWTDSTEMDEAYMDILDEAGF